MNFVIYSSHLLKVEVAFFNVSNQSRLEHVFSRKSCGFLFEVGNLSLKDFCLYDEKGT